MAEEISYADRSDRAKLRVFGPQSAWFLDQILTQSFGDMEIGESRDAALITVHGRMSGYLEAVRTPDYFLLHLEPDIGAAVESTLQRYILSTQVEIADVGDQFGLVLLVGKGWKETGLAGEPVTRQATSALGVPAGYVWVKRETVPAVLEGLQHAGGRAITEDELEAIRISNGIARWGRDMDEKTFPQEAGVDERAVHYEKGCYLGQEAMAKIHFRGKVNRRLARLRAGGPIRAGGDVLLEGTTVGKITSASDGMALAMIRHSVEDGQHVTVDDSPAEVIG
jgi:tRNA-modifying protein YgfZ